MNRTEASKFCADSVIRLARKHLGGQMESSARFCLADAVNALDRGDRTAAAMWAIKSLDYSIGRLHPEHPAR